MAGSTVSRYVLSAGQSTYWSPRQARELLAAVTYVAQRPALPAANGAGRTWSARESRLSRDTQQGFNARQVRDRLGLAASAGCTLAAPVTSREKIVQVMPDGDLQNIRGGS